MSEDRDWNGLYVVDIDDGNAISVTTRYVVVAGSADGAGTIAARAHGWNAADKSLQERITVGRLGDYSPGIGGARMAPYAVIATERLS